MTAQLEHDWLAKEGPQVTVERVDFAARGLPEYRHCYAVVLDNVLTKQECDQLIAAAASTSDGAWERAMVNIGCGQQMLLTETRNCGRIIWDDREVVAKLWDRIKSHVPELEQISQQPNVTGNGPSKRNETWKYSRPNERMRFLKYEGGEYFHSE
jgi:hypothetical protein